MSGCVIPGAREADDWPAVQPQAPPAAAVSQQAAFSDGSQQVSCAAGEQQEEVAVWDGVFVSSAMRSAP
jgi:hypothetical protein